MYILDGDGAGCDLLSMRDYLDQEDNEYLDDTEIDFDSSFTTDEPDEQGK